MGIYLPLGSKSLLSRISRGKCEHFQTCNQRGKRLLKNVTPTIFLFVYSCGDCGLFGKLQVIKLQISNNILDNNFEKCLENININ